MSLPFSQKPANGPYPDPVESRPFIHTLYINDNIILHLYLGLPRGFPTKLWVTDEHSPTHSSMTLSTLRLETKPFCFFQPT